MPSEIQRADRNPPIDHAHAGQLGCDGRLHAILPRAREQGQVESAVIGGARYERARQPVRVFANAAPLAQRRPVIEDDAHLCKSFRASILL